MSSLDLGLKMRVSSAVMEKIDAAGSPLSINGWLGLRVQARPKGQRISRKRCYLFKNGGRSDYRERFCFNWIIGPSPTIRAFELALACRNNGRDGINFTQVIQSC